MSEHQRGALLYFGEALDAYRHIGEGVHLGGGSEQGRLAVLLHVSLSRHAEGVCELLKLGNSASAYVVFRSALESMVDLRCLAKDHAHALVMELTQLRGTLGILRDALNPTVANVYLSELREDYEWSRSMKAKYEARFQELKARGVKEMKMEEKFQRGDFGAEYLGMYHRLSQSAHGGLKALEEHYVRTNEQNGIDIIAFPPLEDKDIFALATASSMVLFSSLETLYGLELLSKESMDHACHLFTVVQERFNNMKQASGG